MLRNLHRRGALAVVLSLALVLSGLGGIVALAETPEQVEVADTDTLSNTLPGNRDTGSFAVYEVDYAGDVALTATLTPLYQDASQDKAFGMKLYLPDGSAVRDISRADGAYRELLYTGNAAKLFLQVFNYSADAVSYDLLVEGADAVALVVPEEPVEEEAVVDEAVVDEAVVDEAVVEEAVAEEAAAEEAVAEEPAAEEAVVEEDVVEEEAAELPEGVVSTGVLVGDRIGAVVEVVVVSETDDNELTVELETMPLDPSFGDAYGFVVYGAEGVVAARGISDGTGTFSASLMADAEESFLVQVYNYAAGQPLAYTLKVTQ